MSKVCPICAKSSRIVGKRVALRATRYNPTSKSRKQPNLQWLTLPSGLSRQFSKKWRGKRIKICAKCLKKNKQLYS